MSDQKLIMFDCDGTLVDSQFVISEAMSRAFTQEGLVPIEREAVRRVVGLHLDEAIATLVPDVPHERILRLSELYKTAFVTIREEGLTEPMFDGVVEAFEMLKAQGHLIGMATGKSRRGVNFVCKTHGLTDFFDVIKTADDGPGKPHPQILLDAMTETGSTPGDTVVIGDTVFDIHLAVNAEAHGIGVNWGYHAPEELTDAGARAVLGRFDELTEVLQGIW